MQPALGERPLFAELRATKLAVWLASDPTARRLALRRLLAAFRFGGAILLYALAARAWLVHELRSVEVTPFMYDSTCCRLVELAHWGREDVQFAAHGLALAVAATLPGAVLAWSRRPYPRRPPPPWLVHLPAIVALLFIAFAQALYYKVGFVMHAQLDYALISEALQSGFGGEDIGEHLDWTDVALVIAPVVPYLALCAESLRGRLLQSGALVALAAAILAIPEPGLHAPREPLRINPAAFVLNSLAHDRERPRPFSELEVEPSPDDLKALGLWVPSGRAPAAAIGPGSTDVVVVILESVGRRYAFPGNGPSPLMPMLQALRDEGVYFSNHLSPSNSSANSLFSFFTGLYPAPSRTVFATQPGLRIPVFHQYLPWIRDAFLVTAGRLSSYFPRGLLTNAQMELRDRYNLGLDELRPSSALWAADERDGVDAFLARLQRAEAPFFGVYYSYAAHYPYNDHGPEYRVRPNLDDPLQRYENNLRLLDTQIGRIIEAVRARSRRTLLVVLGDHGEAFGQHQGNAKHSRQSYQENIETFALLHLPGTLAPRVIAQRTLHIDLLPSALTALGVPFDATAVQGQDVLQGTGERPYSFIYGNEDTLSSITPDGIKLMLSYAKGTCRVFDLSRDPDEQLRVSCAGYREQMRHTGMFHAFQPAALRRLIRDTQ